MDQFANLEILNDDYETQFKCYEDPDLIQKIKQEELKWTQIEAEYAKKLDAERNDEIGNTVLEIQ